MVMFFLVKGVECGGCTEDDGSVTPRAPLEEEGIKRNLSEGEKVLHFLLVTQSLTEKRNSILHSAADSVTSAVQKASQALNERGERLGRAEERTADMMNSAEQFAVTAHKLAMKHKC